MLAYSFGQRALIGGVLIALACSVLSLFVVVRRLAFIGMGISHAALGGVSIGIALSLNPIAAAGVFCSLISVLIGWLTRKGRIHEDTAIGILFSSAMAFGIVLVSIARAYNLDLMSYLFGSILALGWLDIAVLAAISCTALLFVILFFKELMFFAFDEETARASGLPVNLAYYGLLLTLSLTIVVSIKLVGIVLVTAMLVMPAATGIQLQRNYRGVLLVSIVFSLACVVLGLYLSSWFDLPSGSSVVLVMFAVFLLSVAFSPRRAYLRRLFSRISMLNM